MYLKGIIPLTVNGPAYNGYVYDFDEMGIDYWHSFTVTQPGTFNINFDNNLKEDNVVYELLGPNNTGNHVAWTSSSGNTFTYSNWVIGTYYIHIGTVIGEDYYPDGDSETVVYDGPLSLRVYQ